VTLPADTHRRALLVEADIFFAARLRSVLTNLGWSVHHVTTPEALSAADPGELVLLNLAGTVLHPLKAAAAWRQLQNPPKIVAYMSHVRIPEVRDAAMAAGVDRLIPNSAAVNRLPQVLEHLFRDTAPAVIEDEELL
jgi:CheY-like chemotaxis protein